MTAAEAKALLDGRIAIPPACRICGRPMSPTSADASGTVWACHGGDWRTGKWSAFDDQPGRDLADEHYSRSRERVPLAGSYDLASEAVALAEAVVRLEAERDEARANAEQLRDLITEAGTIIAEYAPDHTIWLRAASIATTNNTKETP